LRVAALAFGVLAGLVASLILALGGLDVAPSTFSADRQVQAVRFGLFLIGNVGMFAAALVMASPLAGAILLVLGAIAWVGAALLMHHSTDLVLVTPPSLLLIAAILAFIAHFRRPAMAASEAEILAPLADERPVADNLDAGPEPAMTIPAFAAEPPASRASPLRSSDDPFPRVAADDWDPRKRRPPPPRTKPDFRQPDDEDEDEPSGLARFALGFSSVLSFGLYAALAGAAVLVFWGLRGEAEKPAIVVADVPTISSSSAPPSTTPSPSSSEAALAPALPVPAAPSSASSEPASQLPPVRSVDAPVSVAAAPSSEESFGDVLTSDDPLAPPRLTDNSGLPFDGTASSSEPPPAAPVELEPSAPVELEAPEPSSEPLPAEVEPPLAAAGTADTGALLPFTMSARMAALRTAPGTGPTDAPPSPATNDSGI
jgi:hypothetical protein